MRATRALLALLLLLPLGLAGAEGPSFDAGWMRHGFRAEYVGDVALEGRPSRMPLSVAALAVDGPAITVSFEPLGPHVGSEKVVATYDRETRRAADGSFAYLWVDGESVEAGEAWLGERRSSLVCSSSAYHQFTAAGRNYYFDARTGLLAEVLDLDTGAAVRIAWDSDRGAAFDAAMAWHDVECLAEAFGLP